MRSRKNGVISPISCIAKFVLYAFFCDFLGLTGFLTSGGWIEGGVTDLGWGWRSFGVERWGSGVEWRGFWGGAPVYGWGGGGEVARSEVGRHDTGVERWLLRWGMGAEAERRVL